MAAVLVDVAEAVKDGLNGATLSQSFTAERSYANWDLKLEDGETLRVDVVPVGNPYPATLETRASLRYEASVDIGVRKRFAAAEQDASTGRPEVSEVDKYVLLLEEIHELFIQARLAGYDAAVWQSTEIRTAYDRQHLREWHQYTGIVRVVYRVNQAA